MGTIEVINIKRTPPQIYNHTYIYIGRSKEGNILSNPFTHIKDKDTLAKYVVNSREESIEKFREYFYSEIKTNEKLIEKINHIYQLYENGHKILLGCFCKPLSCHGDIIKEYIEEKYFANQL